MHASGAKTAHLQALLQTSRALSTEIHLDRLLVLIAEKVTEGLDADRSSVFLYDPETEELWSIVAQESFEIRFPISTGLAGYAARTLSTVNVRDAYEDDRFNPEFDRQSGFRTGSVLCGPIVDPSGKLIGVIQVLNRREGFFTSEDEELLEGFCAQAAVALERARMVESYAEQKQVEATLGLARQIQMGMLPERGLIVGPRFEAFSHIRPAQTVGGDFFDIRLIDEHRLGFAIGDVSGKGIPAAIFMHGVYTLLRQSLQQGRPPAYCFEQIDSIHRNEAAMFVTLFYGVLDLRSGAMSYANAGHLPPILIRDGSVRVMDRAENLPLCVVCQNAFTENSLMMKQGDSLLLVTDGIVEARNSEGEPFGLDRSVRAIVHPASGVEEMTRGLIERVTHFAEGEVQHDDMTLLAIRWR